MIPEETSANSLSQPTSLEEILAKIGENNIYSFQVTSITDYSDRLLPLSDKGLSHLVLYISSFHGDIMELLAQAHQTIGAALTEIKKCSEGKVYQGLLPETEFRVTKLPSGITIEFFYETSISARYPSAAINFLNLLSELYNKD